MPRVTVICSTYNWSSVLPYALQSVRRQSFSDWEMLVIGDCCTDDSQQVVEKFCTEHNENRVRWINLSENAGNQFGPNNEGLKQARGELVAYYGHDDLWLAHHLECLVKAIDEGADIAHSIAEWVDSNGNVAAPFAPQECVSPTTVMHRLSAIAQVGDWRDYREIEMPPDADLWARMRRANLRFVFVPRFSVVKFPATKRKNVYKIRPSHEQKAWTQRIQNEVDFEKTELTRMLCDTYNLLQQNLDDYEPKLSECLLALPKKLHPKRLRLYFQHLKKKHRNRKGAVVKQWRKEKGLE